MWWSREFANVSMDDFKRAVSLYFKWLPNCRQVILPFLQAPQCSKPDLSRSVTLMTPCLSRRRIEASPRWERGRCQVSKLTGDVEVARAVRGCTRYSLSIWWPSPSLCPLNTTKESKKSTFSLIKTEVTPWSASWPMERRFLAKTGPITQE